MTTNPYESPETISHAVPQRTNWPRIAIQSLVVIGILALLVVLLLPATRTGSREAARRMQCSNHLKQIALALQNYESAYHSLPPAHTVDAAGKPLHSWRTLILPFLEQQALYDQIDLSRPWDDPANRTAHETNLSVYVCPSGSNVKCQTTYFAVVAPGGCFKETEPRELADITDNRNVTLMLIEVAEKHAVHWMSPYDASEELIVNRTNRKRVHPTGTLGVFVSGYVRFINNDTPPNTLRALISIAGNDDKVAQGDY